MEYSGKIYGKEGNKYFEIESPVIDKKEVLTDFVQKLSHSDKMKIEIGLGSEVVESYLANL